MKENLDKIEFDSKIMLYEQYRQKLLMLSEDICFVLLVLFLQFCAILRLFLMFL